MDETTETVDEGVIRVTVGLANGKPAPINGFQPVCLWFGEQAAVLSPDEARSLALSLIDGAYESFSQSLIAEFLLKGMHQKPAEVKATLAAFARFRQNAVNGEEVMEEDEIDPDDAIKAAGGVYASPHNLVADPDLYERQADALAVRVAEERREMSALFGAALQEAIDTGRARFKHSDGSVRLGPGPDDPLAPEDPDADLDEPLPKRACDPNGAECTSCE